jgi:serine/threonine protein kinase
MAPEALLHGHISKAADVYAFGITLWELFTGGQAYQGAYCIVQFVTLQYMQNHTVLQQCRTLL